MKFKFCLAFSVLLVTGVCLAGDERIKQSPIEVQMLDLVVAAGSPSETKSSSLADQYGWLRKVTAADKLSAESRDVQIQVLQRNFDRLLKVWRQSQRFDEGPDRVEVVNRLAEAWLHGWASFSILATDELLGKSLSASEREHLLDLGIGREFVFSLLLRIHAEVVPQAGVQATNWFERAVQPPLLKSSQNDGTKL